MRTMRFVALIGVLVGAGCNRESLAIGGDAYVDANEPIDASLPSSSCSAVELSTGCVVGHCTLVGALGSVGAVTIAEQAIPSERAGDALGPVLCAITLPTDLPAPVELVLSVRIDATPDPGDTLFAYAPSSPARIVTTSNASSDAVSGLVATSGVFGVAARVAPFAVTTYVGVDVTASGDRAAFLRNVSAHTITSAFSDGTRFYVGNGRRLLVYNTGLPTDPSAKPDVVLGQPSLDTDLGGVSGAGFGGSVVNHIWSDGTRLVAAVGNRVLVWNHVPTASYTPADLVLGQPDFNTDRPNNGGVSASSFATTWSLDSDGTRLLVADRQNHRFLVWSAFPTLIDQPADIVIGQPSFTSNAIGGGAFAIYQATGTLLSGSGAFLAGVISTFAHVPSLTNNVATDFLPPSSPVQDVSAKSNQAPGDIVAVGGGLAITDSWGDRVAFYRTLPTAPIPMDVVLGQPDPARTVYGPTNGASFDPSVTGGPVGMGGGGGMLLVPDKNRLMVYDAAPHYHYEPASRVFGQAGFTTRDQGVDYRGISTRTMASPADVALAGNTVAVADRGNNRVLLFAGSALVTPNAAAHLIVGQPDGGSYVPNLDQHTPSAARLSGPAGVALDGTHLIVADSENHRVLIWNTVPTTDGVAADLVLGQADFTGRRPNRGRLDVSPVDGFSDTAADGFFYPTGVASDGTHLFVADRLNHRVLVWSSFPTTQGQPADAVLGQPDFASNQANRGAGIYAASADGFNLPTGVTLAGTSLWVADTENNRLVRWDTVTTAPTPAAFVGQPDGTTISNVSYYPLSSNVAGYALGQATTSTSVLRPRGVAVAGGRLYASETNSHRVHVFDAVALTHLGQLGQGTATASTVNAGGIGAATLAGPLGLGSDGARLLIADALNHRVVGHDLGTPPVSGTAATIVLGQPTALANGFDQASTASRGVTSRPSGLASFGGTLYVADTSHHRVLAYPSPTGPGTVPTRTFGQPDTNLALPNAGGAASARSLSSPRGLFVDATHLVVADTDNDRVLVFDPTSSGGDAVLVLGQPGFTSVGANPGGPSATTLKQPIGVYFDGTRFFVADSGNHRVLVWNGFPTANGQAADAVLGQASMTAIVANRGLASPTAGSLFSPTAISSTAGVLTIADSGNNRVLLFSTPITTMGPSADGVLGQADLVSRSTTSDSGDSTHLAGPFGLATDGDFLYVADRDLGRVLTYALPLASLQSPARVLNGTAGLALSGPRAIVAVRGAHFVSRVYVADTNNDRVVVIDSVSRFLP